MKFFYQTIVFFFVVLSLFLARDDVVSMIDRVYSHIEKKSETPLIQFEGTKEAQLPSKVDMPGALRVVGNILNVNNTKLSKDSLISLTNKERKDNGNLEALKDNQLLDLTAEKKLQDMFDNQYFEHISSKGVGVGNLADEVGYEYILIGENLAMGNFKDDTSLMDAWMASAGHRANILNKNYTDIGMAVGKGNFEGQNIWMAVQHFGTPRSVCPTIDQVLLGVINLSQDKIKDEESDLLNRKEMIDKGVVYEGSTYSEQVTEYNNLIIPYNNLITDVKKQIDNYNNQVHAFNLCLKNHQQ
jgi:uncharacterized protein YkwD